MLISEINGQYNWLKSSYLYQELKDLEQLNSDFNIAIICTEDENDVELLFKTIIFWKVSFLPIKVLDKLSSLNRQTLVELIHSYEFEYDEAYFFKFYVFADNFESKTNLTRASAKHGFLDVLMWAKKRGYNFDEHTFECAVMNGEIRNLIWLKNNSCPYNKDKILNIQMNRLLKGWIVANL